MLAWESGGQVQINGNCKKATSKNSYTLEGDKTVTTNPVSGGSCSKADFITKL